ncbi:unnamed protein product, partial [Polarella glacialis]
MAAGVARPWAPSNFGLGRTYDIERVAQCADDEETQGRESISSSKSSRRVLVTLGPSAGRRRSTPTPSPERTAYTPSLGSSHRYEEQPRHRAPLEGNFRSYGEPTFGQPQDRSFGRESSDLTVHAALGLRQKAEAIAASSESFHSQAKQAERAELDRKSGALTTNFEKQAQHAWGIEFEADALAARSECRFLQAEVHRLLSERAVEQVASQRTISEMQATTQRLEAEREAERAVLREVRAGLEVATGRLEEGYEAKLQQLEDENRGLRKYSRQLEVDMADTQMRFKQDLHGERSWRTGACGRVISARLLTTTAEVARLCLASWLSLLVSKRVAAVDRKTAIQRRNASLRAASAIVSSSDVVFKRICVYLWQREAKKRIGSMQMAHRAAQALFWECEVDVLQLSRTCFLAWRVAAAVLERSDAEQVEDDRNDGIARLQLRAKQRLNRLREFAVLRFLNASDRELTRSCLERFRDQAREHRFWKEAEAQRIDLQEQVATGREQADAEKRAAVGLVARVEAEATEHCKEVERKARQRIADLEAKTERETQMLAEEADKMVREAEETAEEKVRKTEMTCRIAEEKAARVATVAEISAEAAASRRVAEVESCHRESVESAAKQSLDQQMGQARAEAKLAVIEERERQARTEANALAAKLQAAEETVIKQAGLVGRSEAELRAEIAEAARANRASEANESQLASENATLSAKLAKLSQLAASSQREAAELRNALARERAALAATRGELMQEIQISPKAKDSQRSQQRLYDAARQWRLEHGHSVAAMV